MSNISMQSLVRIHNKLKMKYENKQCSKPQVGIFATDSDSVPDLQQIYNQFLVDHRFKIGCNSVNDNFGQQPIYNRIYIESQVDSQVEIRLQIGCHFFIWNNQIKTVFLNSNSRDISGFSSTVYNCLVRIWCDNFDLYVFYITPSWP